MSSLKSARSRGAGRRSNSCRVTFDGDAASGDYAVNNGDDDDDLPVLRTPSSFNYVGAGFGGLAGNATKPSRASEGVALSDLSRQRNIVVSRASEGNVRIGPGISFTSRSVRMNVALSVSMTHLYLCINHMIKVVMLSAMSIISIM